MFCFHNILFKKSRQVCFDKLFTENKILGLIYNIFSTMQCEVNYREDIKKNL